MSGVSFSSSQLWTEMARRASLEGAEPNSDEKMRVASPQPIDFGSDDGESVCSFASIPERSAVGNLTDEESDEEVPLDGMLLDEAIAVPVEQMRDKILLRSVVVAMNRIRAERNDLVDRLKKMPFTIPYFWQSAQFPAAKFPFLSVPEILKIKNKVPANAFGLLTDQQIKELDFSELSSDQIAACIRGGIGKKGVIQRRFSILSQEQLWQVLKSGGYQEMLEYFPLMYLHLFPIEKLSKEIIYNLFSGLYYFKSSMRKERITLIRIDRLNAILPQLSRGCLGDLSDEQRQNLDYSKMSSEQLAWAFCDDDLSWEEAERRVAQIPLKSITLVVKIASKFNYSSVTGIRKTLLHCLSNRQILALNYRVLISHGAPYHWALKEVLTVRRCLEKVACLPDKIIDCFIEKKMFWILEYISDEQLASINIEKIPLDYLFPVLDPADWYQNCTYKSGPVWHRWTPQNRDGEITYLSNAVVQIRIGQGQEKCLRSFRVLSQAGRFEEIRWKISVAVLQFLESRASLQNSQT